MVEYLLPCFDLLMQVDEFRRRASSSQSHRCFDALCKEERCVFFNLCALEDSAILNQNPRSCSNSGDPTSAVPGLEPRTWLSTTQLGGETFQHPALGRLTQEVLRWRHLDGSI